MRSRLISVFGFLLELLLKINILRRLWYSLNGLSAAWRYEIPFRQEVLLSIVMVPFALYFGHTPLEQALLIAVWLLVIIVELINSAIEVLVDRFGDELHVLSGRAKDLGSAAVFVTILLAIFVWVWVLAF